MGKRKRYLGTVSNFNPCFFCISWNCLYFLRIFFNCAFYAFYKENHALEVPRETRLEKLMRLLEVLKEMHGGKGELSTKTILGVHFRAKSQMEKIKVVAQGDGSRLSCGSYLGGVIIMTCRVMYHQRYYANMFRYGKVSRK